MGFLLLEMIIEATIRLPKNIGPTITMIGGILLGQAIVQAKLVSNLLIIILVASAISNFALTSY
ncbi:spore germination protein [Paenibacillus lautus]|uniref:spore germination protein n=1 Tax=Paenibacillus lautus TaxID=1401 RepID=UPI003D292160